MMTIFCWYFSLTQLPTTRSWISNYNYIVFLSIQTCQQHFTHISDTPKHTFYALSRQYFIKFHKLLPAFILYYYYYYYYFILLKPKT